MSWPFCYIYSKRSFTAVAKQSKESRHDLLSKSDKSFYYSCSIPHCWILTMQTNTVRFRKNPSSVYKLCPCVQLVSTICFYSSSVWWWASADGNVVPQGPWKWNLPPRHEGQSWVSMCLKKKRKGRTCISFCKKENTHEVLGGWCVLHVKLCYRDTSGSHLGSKQGCWIHNRGCANLQRRVHAKILMKSIPTFWLKYFAPG